MRLKRNFDPAEPGTARWYYLDFGPQLGIGETITTQSCVLYVVQGTDATPNGHIGQTAIVGAKVGAFISGLLPGVTYSVEITATTSANNVLVDNARVRCQSPTDR